MADEIQLGKKLRTQRKALGLTLDVLASRAGVARTTISKIERDIISPSLGTLCKIARGMKIKLTSLLDEEQRENETIIKRKNRKFMNLRGSKCKIGCFTKTGANMGIEAVMLIIDGEGDSGLDPPHQGEEVIICQKGTVEFRIGEKRYTLQAGDSIHYKPINHSGLFNTGTKEAQVLWIYSPPRFMMPNGDI